MFSTFIFKAFIWLFMTFESFCSVYELTWSCNPLHSCIHIYTLSPLYMPAKIQLENFDMKGSLLLIPHTIISQHFNPLQSFENRKAIHKHHTGEHLNYEPTLHYRPTKCRRINKQLCI